MKLISYGRQYIDRKDILEVNKSLKADLITTGKYVSKFEKSIEKKFKSKFAISCSSGTAALHLSFLSIGLKKNDIVIMPVINFISSYNICKIIGAKIYLADVDKSTGQITPSTVKDCIRKNKLKNIKLLITMYLGGYPENVINFYNLKKRYNFFIIEDACHALGASYKHNSNWYYVGSCKHSDICVFSLHPLKSITSGEGGLILTNSRKLNLKIKKFRSHGIIRNLKKHWDYDIEIPGLNYRLSDVNCALAYSQLKKLDQFINYRKKIYNIYKKTLSKNFNIKFPEYNNHNKPSFHLNLISVNFLNIKKNKDELISYLKRKNILVQYHYIPLNHFKMYKKKERYLNAEIYYKNTLSLPIYYNLKIKDVKKVMESINNFIKS